MSRVVPEISTPALICFYEAIGIVEDEAESVVGAHEVVSGGPAVSLEAVGALQIVSIESTV